MRDREATGARAHELLATSGGALRVKLCGMSRDEDIAAVNDAGPDLCGFVINFPRSPRSVSPESLGRLVGELDETILAVGVFVDQPTAFVAQVAHDLVDVVQLHGSERNSYITRLRTLTDAPIIQAFRVRTNADVMRANASCADLVLLDNGWGTGRPFDWSLIGGVRRPFMLAGGLTADNVAGAIGALSPWGVDMSSGIETDGRKDPQKIKAATQAARGALR